VGLDITEQALRRFVEEAGPGPVTLVNLVRLRPDGEEAYRAYLEAIGPLIADVGAEAVWIGKATPASTLIDDEPYDLAAVIRSPDAAALLRLVVDARFLAAAPLRHAALEAGILHAFHD
jgi:uncharacterized protein (DUF1330 family)